MSGSNRIGRRTRGRQSVLESASDRQGAARRDPTGPTACVGVIGTARKCADGLGPLFDKLLAPERSKSHLEGLGGWVRARNRGSGRKAPDTLPQPKCRGRVPKARKFAHIEKSSRAFARVRASGP